MDLVGGVRGAMAMNELLACADVFFAAQGAYVRASDDGRHRLRWRLTFGDRRYQNAMVMARVLRHRAPAVFRNRPKPVLGPDLIAEALRALERFIAVSADTRRHVLPEPPAPLWCDASGAVLGVRGWKLTATQRGPVLRAVTSRMQWPPGVTVARCRLDPSACDRPAGRHCVCGLYAFKAADHAGELDGPGVPVVGVVRGWGRVAVHRSGWRAEYVQPIWLAAVAQPQTDVRSLATRYECDVVPVDDTPGRASSRA